MTLTIKADQAWFAKHYDIIFTKQTLAKASISEKGEQETLDFITSRLFNNAWPYNIGCIRHTFRFKTTGFSFTVCVFTREADRKVWSRFLATNCYEMFLPESLWWNGVVDCALCSSKDRFVFIYFVIFSHLWEWFSYDYIMLNSVYFDNFLNSFTISFRSLGLVGRLVLWKVRT